MIMQQKVPLGSQSVPGQHHCQLRFTLFSKKEKQVQAQKDRHAQGQAERQSSGSNWRREADMRSSLVDN